MAETAVESPLDALKGYIGAELGKTKEQIDGMDGKVTEALEEFKRAQGLPAEVVEQLTSLADRLSAVEDTSGRAEALSRGGVPRQGSGALESRFTRAFEGSEHLKRMQEAAKVSPKRIPKMPDSGSDGCIQVPSEIMRSRIQRAAPVVNTDGLAQVPTYRQQAIEWAHEASRLVDRVPTVSCNSETYYWEREDRISGDGIGKIVNGAVLAATTTDVTLDDIDGLIAGADCVIRRTDGAGTLLGYERKTIASFPGGMVVRFTEQIAGAIADDDFIVFNSFAGTAEEGTKPYSLILSSHQSEVMALVAVLFDLTRQAILYNPALEQRCMTKGRQLNRRNLSRLMLYGTGGANQQLQGFLSLTGRQTYLWTGGGTSLNGEVVASAAGDTLADCLLKAALLIPDEDGLIEATIRRPDWQAITSEKASDGHYIYGVTGQPIAVVNTPGLKAVGDLIVNTESTLKQNGDFLVANHGMASELATADMGEFAFGYINDDFGVNKIKGRWEEVLLHAILSLQMFVHGNFNARP